MVAVAVASAGNGRRIEGAAQSSGFFPHSSSKDRLMQTILGQIDAPPHAQTDAPTDSASLDSAKDPKNNILIWYLTREIAERGWTIHDAATAIDVSYPYLQALLRGQRPIAQASKSVLAAMANFLDVPVAQAFIWSGALTAEDFFRKRSLESEMSNLYEQMLESEDFGAYMPTATAWTSLDINIRVLIAALYERVTGERILAPVTVPTEDA
jgi:transcriptional regulator with XRE-family HTH domain